VGGWCPAAVEYGSETADYRGLLTSQRRQSSGYLRRDQLATASRFGCQSDARAHCALSES
jgi:hypothetical protein